MFFFQSVIFLFVSIARLPGILRSMAAVPDDSSHSDGFTLRMCEDNTSHPVAMPKLQLYPPDYQVGFWLLSVLTKQIALAH